MSNFALILACRTDSIIDLQKLRLSGVALSQRITPDHGYGPCTPLIIAIQYNSINVIKYLIEISKVNTEVYVPSLYRPLNNVTALLTCTKLLTIQYMSKWVNMYAMDDHGDNLLYYIIYRVDPEPACVEWLLNFGLRLNRDDLFITNATINCIINKYWHNYDDIYRFTLKKPVCNILKYYDEFATLKTITSLPCELIVEIAKCLFN
jgi:hypothetical protein